MAFSIVWLKGRGERKVVGSTSFLSSSFKIQYLQIRKKIGVKSRKNIWTKLLPPPFLVFFFFFFFYFSFLTLACSFFFLFFFISFDFSFVTLAFCFLFLFSSVLSGGGFFFFSFFFFS